MANLRKFEKNFLVQTRIAGKQSNTEIRRSLRNSMKDVEWPANEPNYLRWKSLYGYSTRPLFRTSLLYNSIGQELKLKSDRVIGQIGWHEGARYPGDLKEKVWKGRVPSVRRKSLAPASGPYGPRMTSNDTNYLAQVAYWNERGEGGVYKVERIARRVRNGRYRNRQKFRSKYYDRSICVQLGRTARPFVANAFNESDVIPGSNFEIALSKTVKAMFGGARGPARASSPVEDVPF